MGKKMKKNTYTGIRTTAIHAGEGPDPATNASAPPLHMSSTFVSEVMQDYKISAGTRLFLELVPSMFLYSRTKSKSKNISDQNYKKAITQLNNIE